MQNGVVRTVQWLKVGNCMTSTHFEQVSVLMEAQYIVKMSGNMFVQEGLKYHF